MAFLFKHPKSKYWCAGFYDSSGKRRNRSTRTTSRREAQKIADVFEEAARKQRTARQVRDVIADLHETITGEELKSVSMADFVVSWLDRKKPETADSTLTFYRGSSGKFLDFLEDESEELG